MKAGARLIAQLENGHFDFVAPSIEPLLGLGKRCLSGWKIEEIISNYIPPDFSVRFVDVGACVGSWGISIAFHFPSASVVCIEPYKPSYDCLVYNSKAFPNLRTLNLAADREQGRIRLSLPDLTKLSKTHSPDELWHNYGLITAYGEPDKFALDVDALPLDEIIGTADVIKIDVEGMEARVLAGAQRILKESKPILQVEMSERNQKGAGSTIEELKKIIESYEYKSLGFDGNDEVFIPKNGRTFRR